jgi:crotonobetainyl-CoA:carnitine CoA-transferase CaiB-like acyl-CoA transferase
MGGKLAARGADRDARLPGGALDDRARGPRAGRQRPSDQHPDRRVPDQRRLHQHRLGRRRDLRPVLPRRRPARPAEHPDYKTGRARSDNRKALNAAIEEITRHHTSAEWIDRLNKAGVPSGPIYKMDEVFADPQVKHLGIAQKVHHRQLGDIELVGQAVTLSRTPSRLKTASPDPGEHTDAILGELGYSAGDIARLRERGVV